MPKHAISRFLKLAPALILLALALPSAASAQATRTWVSGVGDDANPCSRTAPCKTFAGSISKTAAGGEINVIDSGAYGTVTITKSITIDGHSHYAGVLGSGGINGVVVNAAATDKVTLRNLNINGGGTASRGLNGVHILQAKSVKILDSKIYNWTRSGVNFQASNVGAKLVVQDSDIIDNLGNGVNVAPPNGGIATATVRRVDINDNACGIVAATYGMDPAYNFGTACGTANVDSGISGRATINTFRTGMADNTGYGVFANGNKSVDRISAVEVSGSITGMGVLDQGQIISAGNNVFYGNSVNGAPTTTVGLLKR
jgi:hypothetical protein